MEKRLLSVVIPAYDEEKNIPLVYGALADVFERTLADRYTLEIVFVDDGSQDGTAAAVQALAMADPRVRLIEFSRNFGKEIATTAGIHACRGAACVMLDADLQHPPELLPEFVARWEAGTEVVIGVRRQSRSDSRIKRWGSSVFYRLIRMISDVPIVSHATDYRLLDRAVVDAFNGLSERNRLTRGLIDWLGFRRGVIYFDAKERRHGIPGYDLFDLVRLGVTSVISLSLFPLRLAGYLGVVIVLLSGGLGVVMAVDRFVVPSWGLNFSGPAILAAIILFMVGIILVCIGLLAFYIGHIYHEAQGRPLYVVRAPSARHEADSGTIDPRMDESS